MSTAMYVLLYAPCYDLTVNMFACVLSVYVLGIAHRRCYILFWGCEYPCFPCPAQTT